MGSPGALPPTRRLAMLGRLLHTLGTPPRPRTVPAFSAANLPPMQGRLELIRDANGVLHLYSEVEADLYAALGFAQAADRFFALDLLRHLGAGRLCALFGNLRSPARQRLLAGRRVADIDGFVRPLGLEAQSRTDFTRLSPRAVALLTAFADGVNAGLRAMRGRYPPEYLLTAAVQPWHPADCLVVGCACAFIISLASLDNELTFDSVRGALGDDVARRMYPDAPWQQVPQLDGGTADRPTPEPPIRTPVGGSNNWAVAATHSLSGAPLVANDPHVPFMLPTFWHHVHLECAAYRVQGGVFPGCPVFGFGHNGALAWGCTTGFRDGYDVYRVHRLPGDASRYRTVRGSGAITKHREVLASRFRRRIVLEWERCEHGIIYPGWRHRDGIELAVRPIPSDLAHYFEGYLALAAAPTLEAHRAALALINDGPFDFNHVYAHRDGAVGWELFGRLPRRRHDGLFVRDAHDPEAQWDGWVPFEEMPKLRDPRRGFVASANSTTDPHNHAVAFTSVHCEPRYRMARIESVLASVPRHGADSFAALQRDVVADYAPPLRDALVRAIGAVNGNAVAARALDCWRAWDGRFSTDSCGALLYALMQQDLPARLFTPLLGADLGPRYTRGRRAMPRLHQLLLDPADPLRTDIERAARRSVDDLLRESFFAAVNRVAPAQGADPSRWRLGAMQRVRLGTAFSLLPVIGRRFVALDEEFPGDEYTVSPSRSIAVGGSLYAVLGATSRFICDLATPDEALFAHSAGPSADPGSTFFANLSGPWHRFEYFRSALWKPRDVPQPVEHLVIE